MKTALLLTLSILVALAAGEVAVRIVLPQFLQGPDPVRNPFWEHDPLLGWRHHPGSRGLFEREEFTHPVTINSAGWRDRERSVAKPPGLYRVAVLGDSFTWGHGVADEAVFTRLMERGRPDLEVLNFGLSGSATDQQLLILRERALAYAPDLVLVMICRNDFAALLTTAEGSYPKPRFELDPEGRLILTGVPVPEVSFLSRWHYRLRGRLALLNLIESRFEQRAPPEPSRSGRAYALMEAILRAMAAESKGRGARFAIGLVPSNAHTYLDPIPIAERRRHETLREIAGRAGFPVLDLVPAFRSASVSPVTGERVDLHFRRDLHWNERGHSLVAAELLRLLTDGALIPVAPGGAPL